MKRGCVGLLPVACVLLAACSARAPLASPGAPAVDAQALIRRQRDTATEAVLQQFRDVPLLQYRVGTCGQTSLLHVLLFDLSVVTRRKAIEELSASQSSTETASRQIASHERAIAEAEMRRAEAARSADAIRRHLSSNSR